LKNALQSRDSSGSIPLASPDIQEPTDRDLTLENTMQNAGHRRSSSSVTRSAGSRRTSGAVPTQSSNQADDDNNMRLKWDEANLYLTEQEKNSTMKITEPKTPYAKQYDPTEDAAELATLDGDELMVDELDKKLEEAQDQQQKKRAKDSDIPDLELGEPEETVPENWEEGAGRMSRSGSLKGKQVMVEPDSDGLTHENGEPLTEDEAKKHREFEEHRKRHYEMRNVKSLLAHHSDDEMEEEDANKAAPSLPKPVQNEDIKMTNRA
jgi:protein phosphatase inhibitor 2